jgi:hypothetical protein
MTRYVLAARLGEQDDVAIKTTKDEQLVNAAFLDDAGVLRHGIGRSLRDLRRMGPRPTATAIDLLVLAVLVYLADTRINRQQTSQDNWTREIRLVVPVSDRARWDASGDLIANTLRFLTGDLWQVTFRKWPKHIPHPSTLLDVSAAVDFDCVSLFSGGLDSLIGAIDSLETGLKPLFVSHGGDGSVSGPQQQLFDSLTKLYQGKTAVERLRMGLRLKADIVPDVLSEDSTRGRSFLFFALGAFAASTLGKPASVRVPENGLISLNVPLDGTRLGSNSTRTTHPYYVHRWNELLRALDISCTLVNPYWDQTKGEMITGCANPGFLKKLAATSVSCAHPSYKRYAQDNIDHCGTCVPCIIRRASFAASSIKDPTEYRIVGIAPSAVDATTAEGEQVRAFDVASSRLHKNPALAPILIHKPGPLIEDASKLAGYAGVYSRGMGEVRNLLNKMQGKN